MLKKNKFLRYLLIGVVVLFVFVIIGRSAGWIGGPDKKTVSTEKVQRRSIVESVSASGKIQPEVEVKISPDVSGEIVELTVKEGDHVTKGQVLAKILPDIYQSSVERSVAAVNSSKASYQSAQARLVQAQSQLTKSKINYDRNKKLYADKLISANEYESIESSYEVAKAEVDAAQEGVKSAEFGIQSSQASLKESQDNLKKTTIVAPVDATIAKLNKEQGERVVGTSMMEGTEIMRLANLNEMEVSVDVNENDIMRVSVGDSADIEVDAYLGKKFKGVVTEVANSANTVGTNVDQVTNFTVKVRILRESYAELAAERKGRSVFNPGMSATTEIHTKSVYNVLSIPIQGVTTRDTSAKGKGGGKEMKNSGDEMQDEDEVRVVQDDKNKKKEEKKEVEVVFLVDKGKAKLIPVKPGIQDNSYIEIKEGLKEGQEVIVAPYSAIAKMLKDGDLIEIVRKDQLFDKEKK
jgi:HlyD family secretion protein